MYYPYSENKVTIKYEKSKYENLKQKLIRQEGVIMVNWFARSINVTERISYLYAKPKHEELCRHKIYFFFKVTEIFWKYGR